MSKFNFKNINYQKIGDWMMDMLRSNSGTIVGGLSMIGLSLLCRKLGVPYQVLTDPAYSRTRTSQTNYSSSEYAQTLYLMPTDAVEASIAAIYNSSVNLIYDSEKLAAAKEIMSVIAARKNDIPDTTVSYGISLLQALAKTMIYDSNKRTITQFISKLGKGDF